MSKDDAEVPCSGRESVGMWSVSTGRHGTFQEVEDLKVKILHRLRHADFVRCCEYYIEVETSFDDVGEVIFGNMTMMIASAINGCVDAIRFVFEDRWKLEVAFWVACREGKTL